MAQWKGNYLPDVGLISILGRFPGEGNGHAWESTWTEQPGGLQSMGLQKNGTQLGD